MRTSVRAVALLLGAVLAMGLITGCGGDEEDPQAVLDAALGGGEQIDSGVLELRFDLQSEGEGQGSVTAALDGPFQSGDDGSLPQLDLTASASGDAGGEAFDFEGGLTLTADGGFVNYGGGAYQLDPATFALLQQSYQQSSQLQDEQADTGSLEQFGVDPASWVTDLTNEGTEDLDGTEVVHVSGSADVGRIVDDLSSIAAETGQAEALDPNALGIIESSVEEATIDVYANAADDTLRRLDLDVQVADPTGSGGTVTLNVSIGIAEPNEAQQISAPPSPRPFAELAAQVPELAALGGLATTGGAGAVPPTGGGAAGGAGGAGADPASEYFDCVAKASGAAAVQKCADLLGG